jgi:SET domain-containing protein
MQHYHLPHFLIKNGIHGIGVFTTTDVKKGELLFEMTGEVLDHPTRTSVQIGLNQHIEDEIAGHMNHSCIPTARVDRQSKSFISVVDIKKGEEITFNYNENEDTLAAPFTCACCGNKIRGRNVMAKSERVR